MRILIVEDESPIANGLKFNFEQEGFEAVIAPDGPSALKHFESKENRIDLVVLDLMLPGMSGYAACRRIRERDQYVPILVLSARTLSEDKAQAFDVGTDQYMTKPFELPELLSRVRNLLERRPMRESALPSAATGGVFQFGNVNIDFDTYEISVDDKTHRLTKMELQLLRYFAEHEGKVLSRANILKHVWDEKSDVTTRTIDNFVLRLRKLVETKPTEPRHILSVRGTGYRFITTPDDASGEHE